jgi:hypothetical protein
MSSEPIDTPTIRVASTDDLYGDPDVRIGGDADLDEGVIRLAADVEDHDEIVDTVIHETLHLVLVHVGEREASHAIDNTYEDYHRVDR